MKDNTKNKTGKFNIKLNYWTGLIIYAVVLLIIGICVYIYTGSCVKKYENSQSDKVMDGFLKDFEKMVDDKTLADNIELPASSEFEGKDTFVNMYMSEFDGVSGYTYKKRKISMLFLGFLQYLIGKSSQSSRHFLLKLLTILF